MKPQDTGGGTPLRRYPSPVIHENTVRVRYGEVDRMGVVYHAHYLPYFETGRTEFLRALGRVVAGSSRWRESAAATVSA